jgi:hypothetical protein
MKKRILIFGIVISTSIYSCSKSVSKANPSATGGTCFECTIQNTLVKYCQKNENTVTVTANGQSEEDTFTNGWTQFVTDTKSGVATVGGTCN